jgi:hypothetical protein
MIKYRVHVTLIAGLLLLLSCKTSEHFYDPVSRERQKELVKNRSGNIFSDIGLSIASLFTMAAFEVDIGLFPQGHEFKKLKIINPKKDTLYVNMLTDVFWDEDNYCDFMDIRIPPKEKCKLLLPVDANYNVYFSATPEKDDDEHIEINTNDFKRISLYPGLTLPETESEKKLIFNELL